MDIRYQKIKDEENVNKNQEIKLNYESREIKLQEPSSPPFREEAPPSLREAASPSRASPPPFRETSPPSAHSSPSPGFSFTVSHHINTPSSSAAIDHHHHKAKNTPSPIDGKAVDLSPADEIFLRGHLLPFHFQPGHPPLSPRSSINSLDSFTLPIKELLQPQEHNNSETTTRIKSKSFSLFGIQKLRKGCDEVPQKQKMKKLKFEVSHVLKRYIKIVRPFLSFGNRKRENMDFEKQSTQHSYSGNLSFRDHNYDETERIIRRVRGAEYSAPASIWTSPTNSGHLKATSSKSTTHDSSMEELQSAIQAAIVHCKNSNSNSMHEKRN